MPVSWRPPPLPRPNLDFLVAIEAEAAVLVHLCEGAVQRLGMRSPSAARAPCSPDPPPPPHRSTTAPCRPPVAPLRPAESTSSAGASSPGSEEAVAVPAVFATALSGEKAQGDSSTSIFVDGDAVMPGDALPSSTGEPKKAVRRPTSGTKAGSEAAAPRRAPEKQCRSAALGTIRSRSAPRSGAKDESAKKPGTGKAKKERAPAKKAGKKRKKEASTEQLRLEIESVGKLDDVLVGGRGGKGKVPPPKLDALEASSSDDDELLKELGALKDRGVDIHVQQFVSTQIMTPKGQGPKPPLFPVTPKSRGTASQPLGMLSATPIPDDMHLLSPPSRSTAPPALRRARSTEAFPSTISRRDSIPRPLTPLGSRSPRPKPQRTPSVDWQSERRRQRQQRSLSAGVGGGLGLVSPPASVCLANEAASLRGLPSPTLRGLPSPTPEEAPVATSPSFAFLESPPVRAGRRAPRRRQRGVSDTDDGTPASVLSDPSAAEIANLKQQLAASLARAAAAEEEVERLRAVNVDLEARLARPVPEAVGSPTTLATMSPSSPSIPRSSPTLPAPHLPPPRPRAASDTDRAAGAAYLAQLRENSSLIGEIASLKRQLQLAKGGAASSPPVSSKPSPGHASLDSEAFTACGGLVSDSRLFTAVAGHTQEGNASHVWSHSSAATPPPPTAVPSEGVDQLGGSAEGDDKVLAVWSGSVPGIPNLEKPRRRRPRGCSGCAKSASDVSGMLDQTGELQRMLTETLTPPPAAKTAPRPAARPASTTRLNTRHGSLHATAAPPYLGAGLSDRERMRQQSIADSLIVSPDASLQLSFQLEGCSSALNAKRNPDGSASSITESTVATPLLEDVPELPEVRFTEPDPVVPRALASSAVGVSAAPPNTGEEAPLFPDQSQLTLPSPLSPSYEGPALHATVTNADSDIDHLFASKI